MHSSKKKITYVLWTMLAVGTGLLVTAGITKTAEYAYARAGSPGKELIASIDLPKIKIGIPKLGKSSKLLAESITYERQKDASDEALPTPTVDGSIFIKPADENTIRIAWVGDVTPVPKSKTDTPLLPFAELEGLLALPDITTGNLEGVITETTTSTKCKDATSNCFSFRGDIAFADLLKNASFDVMNMANNHAFDFGKVSFTDTQNALTSKQITPTGAPDQISIVETKGVKVAFIGFAPNAGTNPLLDTEHMKSTITKAKTEADLVVVFMHAGAEGVNYLHVTDADEIYLNENRGNTLKIAHVMVDAGADLVLGSGPHVLRGIEKYKGKVIAYSLGNFFASTNLSTRGLLSLSGIFMIDLDKSGNAKIATIVPVYLDSTGVPHIDPVGTAIPLINKLSREDFGDNGAVITDEGIIKLQ